MVGENIVTSSYEFAESVINTVREPLISLDHDLRVVTVNRSFYEFFKVKPEEADLLHFDSAARYGVNAMELLINRIMAIGGNRFQLVAKIFGGAHLLPSISIENGVGKKNAEQAEKPTNITLF